MAITGKLFIKVDTELADIEVQEVTGGKQIDVSVDGVTKVLFPVPASADINEIKARLTNLLQQTAFKDKGAFVELTETP